MQKIVFSLRRTLAVAATGVLGFFLILEIIFRFLIPESGNFTYVQWAYLSIGVLALSFAIQYVPIKLIDKYMPLEKK